MTDAELTQLVQQWLNTGPTYTDQRRFLEAHPEIVSSFTVDLLTQIMTIRPLPQQEDLRLAREVIRYALARGATTEAIRDAYVNARGGFILDLPAWLMEERTHDQALAKQGRPDQVARPRIALWQAALTRAEAEGLPDAILAEILNRLAYHLDEASGIDRPDLLEARITAQTRALVLFARDRYPYKWAMTQNNLGNAYQERIREDRAANLEAAIAAYSASLQVYTRQDFPVDWAMTQNNLGIALRARIRGDRAANLEAAIAAYSASLEVRTRQDFPVQWATTQNNLGAAYDERIREDRAANLEAAIAAYSASLQVYTRQDFPVQWATTQNNLGIAYSERIRGDRAANLEAAIAAYTASLEVYTRQDFPVDWAMTQNNLGNALRARIRGDRAANLEAAIAAYSASLEVRTRRGFPVDWAMTQNNLGNALRARIRGDRAANLEAAIAAYSASLEVYTRQDFPVNWAGTQNNLGAALCARIRGDRAANLEAAIAAYSASLAVRTRAAFPHDYRDTQENLALAYEDAQRWRDAHVAYAAARAAERDLLEGASSQESRRDLIAYRAEKDLYLRDTRTTLRLAPPDLPAALEALEEGRAQGMRATLALDAVTVEAISDPAARERMAAFIDARDAWLVAQRSLAVASANQQESLRQTVLARHQAFIAARDAIRSQDNPDFLAPLLPFAGIAHAAPGPESALIYLTAGPEGGFALSVTRDARGQPQAWQLPLPTFTDDALFALLQTEDTLGEDSLVSGGIIQAQMHWSFGNLQRWGASAQEALAALPSASGFAEALRRLQAEWLSQPFAALSDTQREDMAGDFTAICVQVELARALPKLGELVFTPLAEDLWRRGLRRVALVPYGRLALFPLGAVPITLGGQTLRFGDVFETGVAPSARALIVAHERADHTSRSAVLAVGNPKPLFWAGGNLPFAEAEADTIARIARRRRPGSTVLGYTLAEANRVNVIAGLRLAWYVHLALHGQFNLDDPRATRIILQGEASVPEEERIITLGECLDGMVDLRGVRVLVLSACETAVIEARQSANEVIGLAAAFLQAGASAVLAALWPVDDRATFLLMSRFANLLLDPRRNWSPARCLAEAQRWLRDEATNAVLRTYDPTAEIPLAGIPLDLAAMPTQRRTAPSEWDREPLAVRRRVLPRYKQYGAMEQVREMAKRGPDDACPYHDEQFWAAFTVTGV
jgi:CHAT domain-containing protein/predicted LPLAT superfamily acyltransferase